MDIRAAEISSILKEQIKNFGREAEVSEIGQVLSVGDGIARVYGLEAVDGGKALVMELVEGLTLADRVAHGPIPLAEALPIAKQIAEALAADEAMLTSASNFVLPVVAIDGKPIGTGTPGPVARRLREIYIAAALEEAGVRQ